MVEAHLHIYRCENPKRTRRMCPVHKRLEYGELQEFYDTHRVFFDCGTVADYGYGYYEPPKQYKRLSIFFDNEVNLWKLFSVYTRQKLAERKTKSGITKIAKYHLKSGGKIEFN